MQCPLEKLSGFYQMHNQIRSIGINGTPYPFQLSSKARYILALKSNLSPFNGGIMKNVRQRTLTIEVGKTEYVFCSPIVEELANSESAYAGKSDKISLEEASATIVPTP